MKTVVVIGATNRPNVIDPALKTVLEGGIGYYFKVSYCYCI